MSRTQALHFLRQCANTRPARLSGLSHSNILRPAYAHARPRHFSDVNGKDAEVESGRGSEQGPKPPETDRPSTSGQSAEPELVAKLKGKDQEVTDLTGRLRYLQADFLNLQRNAAREKEQTRDYAITRFAGDLLETVDVLSLALKSVPDSALMDPDAASSTSVPPPQSTSQSPTSSPDTPSSPNKTAHQYLTELHHGVDMTHRLLLQTLFKYGVKPFDPTGDAFDPNRHEALYQAPTPNAEPGTIIDCQKIGYTIKDRTLRAAQVGVASESS